MRHIHHPLLLAVLVSLLAGLALLQIGCSSSGGASPDTLIASRTVPPPTPRFHPEPFSQTVDEPTGVQKVYHDIYNLPPIPAHENCPLDYGLRYTLTFVQSGKTVLTVTADPNGCAFVRISASDVRATSLDLWGDLAALLGRPLYDVYVLPMLPTPGATMTACDTPTP